ncbi:MAG TPA: hypothetical protein VER33_27870 [Polyangiaceae bacterium]|nr:hypothetical protein [Polyangiaceae bacterium]
MQSALLCVLLVGVAHEASAAEPAQQAPQADQREAARALADEAANAYATGDYARAVELLRRAYVSVPAPTIALLEGRSLARLGRLLEAQEAYNRAIATPVDAATPPAFTRAIAEASKELSALLPRIPQLRVVLTGSQAAALSITLDERALPAASLGEWFALDPGKHRVVTEQPGQQPRAEELVLREGERRELLLAPAIQARSRVPVLGIAVMSFGGAAVLTGVATGLVAVSAHGDAEKRCPGNNCVPGSAGADDLDRFHAFETVSTVSYVVGAAGLGLGTYLVLTSRPSADAPSSGLAISPTLGGLQVRGWL